MIDYEQEVRKVYPNAYMCVNSLFETCCVYEDFTFKNRVSERTKNIWSAWQDAYDKLLVEGKIKPL